MSNRMSSGILLRCALLVGFALFLSACARRPVVATAGPCADGKGSTDRQAPIVCVDDTGATLSVFPDPIVLHDTTKGGGGPVVLQWFTRTGTGDLQLQIEEGCVSEVTCNGRGHCTAKSRDIDAETRCKYDVWTDKHPRLDPEVVVDPCC